MNDLIKIKEVSDKYDITARTLRYYEDMGLISSIRNNNYAYRLYDESAIKRLEQILILRKLNISIKDIKRVFNSPGSDVVLDVLGKKVQNIDDEVALLHELKEIVLEFIRQIEKIDFNGDSNVKTLYERAKEIETHLVSIDYIGKPSNVGRLLEVTEKLEKKPDIRIVELPACRMVISGEKKGNNHKKFEKMWGRLDAKRKDKFFPRDFMVYDSEKGVNVWWYAIEDWVSDKDTEGFEIINFDGGLYATAITHDWDDNIVIKAYNAIKEWLSEHDKLAYDERPGRYVMFHVNGPDKNLLGYIQSEYFFPIYIKESLAK